MSSSRRESWELKVSIYMQTMKWYLEFLSIDPESERAKHIESIYGAKDLHEWALMHIIETSSRIRKEERNGARVDVDQETLKRLEKITGVKATEYNQDVTRRKNDGPDAQSSSMRRNASGHDDTNDSRR